MINKQERYSNDIFFSKTNFLIKYIFFISFLKIKTTDRFKRPFKKRHSSLYHQPTNRVNKFLSQAIEARSVDHEKSAHVNRFTLQFRDRDVERNYHKDIDLGFSIELLCSLLLLMLSTALQVAVFPRTFILLLLFLTAFIWIASILMLMLAARLKWILWDLSHSFTLRLAIIVFTIILLYSVGQVNVVSAIEIFGLNTVGSSSTLSEDITSCIYVNSY